MKEALGYAIARDLFALIAIAFTLGAATTAAFFYLIGWL